MSEDVDLRSVLTEGCSAQIAATYEAALAGAGAELRPPPEHADKPLHWVQFYRYLGPAEYDADAAKFRDEIASLKAELAEARARVVTLEADNAKLLIDWREMCRRSAEYTSAVDMARAARPSPAQAVPDQSPRVVAPLPANALRWAPGGLWRG